MVKYSRAQGNKKSHNDLILNPHTLIGAYSLFGYNSNFFRVTRNAGICIPSAAGTFQIGHL